MGPEGLHIPQPASFEMLAAVHDPAYVRQVLDADVPAKIESVIDMPVTRGVSDRAQAAVGGTLLAAHLALQHGLACNTAGGSHHAGPRHRVQHLVENALRLSSAAWTWSPNREGSVAYRPRSSLQFGSASSQA